MAENLDSQQEGDRKGLLSRYHLLTLYLPAVILALGHGIATPAIPVFAKSFGTGFGIASLVIVVYSLGSLISTIPTGFLLDKVGRRPILLSGPILTAVSSLLIATAHSFPALLIYRFIGGWAQQMWRQSRLAIIADTGRKRERGRQMTGLVAMESAGRLLGPALGGLLGGRNIRIPFIVHGILSLAAVLPSIRLVRETAPTRTQSSSEGEESIPGTKAFLISLLNIQYLSFFSAQFFATMARGALWGGTLLLYAAYAYDVGPETLGLLSAGTGLVGIPITLFAGYLMDRFGRKTTIVPGFALTATGLVFMALSAHWHWSLSIFIVIFIWVYAAQSITSGNMQVLGADIAPESARGRFFGVWRMIGGFGHLLSPAIFALLAEQVAYTASFSFLSLCGFAAAAIVGLQVSETVRRRNL